MKSDSPTSAEQKTDATAQPRSGVPSPGPEQRRTAAGHFEHANQLVAAGDYARAVRLLRECCRIDPANLLYRQALRRTEKAWYNNNLRGWRWAFLFNWPLHARLRRALAAGRHLEALDLGERILVRNPWDVPAQMRMARAAESLQLIDLAVWLLEQARHKDPENPPLNRLLARLYEQRGNFTQALGVWEAVQKTCPEDLEAQRKLNELLVHRKPEVAEEADALAQRSPVASESMILKAEIAEDPTRPALHLQLARLYRRSIRLGEARDVLLQALMATGQAFELQIELADLEIEPFRRDLAIAEEKLARQHLAGEPPEENLQSIRLGLRREINTRELELHRRMADRFPADAGHRYEVGVRLVRAGQLDEGIRELQAVRGDDHLRGRALLALGLAFMARNNWRLAQRNFEEALSALPVDFQDERKEALYQLANGLVREGELARAIEVGCELAHLDFGYRDIGRQLDEWQTLQRQAQAS